MSFCYHLARNIFVDRLFALSSATNAFIMVSVACFSSPLGQNSAAIVRNCTTVGNWLITVFPFDPDTTSYGSLRFQGQSLSLQVHQVEKEGAAHSLATSSAVGRKPWIVLAPAQT